MSETTASKLESAEDDVVDILLRRARAIAAEIERLQKELMEARARENNHLITLERLEREESTIRPATIEECAKVAEGWEVEAGGGTYMTSGGARYWDGDHDYHQARMDAASDIRALNSNGKGKP